MQDPMLEEIWRVRDELIQLHGGVQGYQNYLRSLDEKRPSKVGRKPSTKRAAAKKNGRATQRNTAKSRAS